MQKKCNSRKFTPKLDNKQQINKNVIFHKILKCAHFYFYFFSMHLKFSKKILTF